MGTELLSLISTPRLHPSSGFATLCGLPSATRSLWLIAMPTSQRMGGRRPEGAPLPVRACARSVTHHPPVGQMVVNGHSEVQKWPGIAHCHSVLNICSRILSITSVPESQ